MLLGISVPTASAKNTHKSIKKVVSIVYDDSGSMNNANEDWAYASYSLQNLVGLMNTQDELGVVKMSSPYQVTNIDLSIKKRAKEIKTVENYKALGMTTPFEAVDTAVDWIKQKKSGYTDNQSVEFWLVIITDGSFESGYPKNMKAYLKNLKGTMGDSKFEGICVAIGNNVPDNVKREWNSVTGNHLITASNSNDIVNAMAEVSALILGQGGKGATINVSPKASGKSITFVSKFPLKKFIIYEQNQSVGVKSVSAKRTTISTTADFSTKKPGVGAINSRTIHCESADSDYIPAGKITVNFDSKIDTLSSNFKILIESAVNVDFEILDSAGNKIDVENNALVEGDLVEFAASITSCIDHTPINLKDWAREVSAQLVVNDKEVEMQYNQIDNKFYGSFRIQSGSNLAYAIVSLPGYFRTKSDVINLYPIEVIEKAKTEISKHTLNVQYKFCEEYEEIGALCHNVYGGVINGIFDFEFKNMPKGITASVNGIFANEEGKLSVKVHNDVPSEVILYRNKDYSETEESKIVVNTSSQQYKIGNPLNNEIILQPVKRELALELAELKDLNNIKINNFNNKAVYVVSVLEDGEYLTKEELDTLFVQIDKLRGISFETEVVEYNGRYALQLICKKELPQIFVKTGEMVSNITCTTIYDEVSAPATIKLHMKDSLTKYMVPILLLLIPVLLLGYLLKKKIHNKKYHIRVNNEDEAIHIKPFSRLMPFISEKGYGGGLMLTGTTNKNNIVVSNDFFDEQEVYLDGEKVTDRLIPLSTGSELIVKEKYAETKYEYCDSRCDDSFGDCSDSNDFFSDSTISDGGADDDFFS